MPNPIDIIHIASHESRWAILNALRPAGAAEPGSTAQDLADKTGLTQYNVAYHMKELVRCGLVTVLKDPDVKNRLLFSRRGFLAEMVVDLDHPGAEATFTPRKPAKESTKAPKHKAKAKK